MRNGYKSLAFIGGGNMAAAIIGGLVQRGYPAALIHAADPSDLARRRLADQFGIKTHEFNNQAVAAAEVVVLAVKPQVLGDVCHTLMAQLDGPGERLYLSIAAGIPLASLKAYLQGAPRIVRAMPNTPALVGLGMTGLYAPAGVNDQDKQLCERLLEAVGKVLWVADEAGINSVIAAAGSAPAYFFLLMEAMQQAAINMGLSADDARLLIAQTALGSAQMALEKPEPFATLRQQVTSKGGTTAAALSVFENQDFSATVAAAMHAAVERAEAMAREF
jgi:pyrroline-5-carboxylate reductase